MSRIITGTVGNGRRVAVDFTIFTGLAGVVVDEDGQGGALAMPVKRPISFAKRSGFVGERRAQIVDFRACDIDPRTTIARFAYTDEADA